MKTFYQIVKVAFFSALCLLIAQGSPTGALLVALGSLLFAFIPKPSGAMFALIDPSDITWNGDEVRTLAQAIYEKTFGKPSITSIHRVEGGIKAKKQIVFLGKLGLVGKKRSDCDTSASSESVTMSEKFWEPEYVGDRFKECWDTLKESFFIWGTKNGLDKEDLTSTDFANFLEDRLSDAIEEAVLRLVWFNDTDADTVYNDGVLTNGTDKTFFNVIDGLWKQLFDIGTSDSNRVVAISKNSQSSYANQKFNSTDTTNLVATGIFDDLLYEADQRLRDQPNKIILATQSLVDQYARERKKASGIDMAYERQENGIDTFKVNGITVVPMPFWDRMIRTYEDNGTKYHLPHRAILTTIDNIPVGTEDLNNLSEFKPFYDMVSKNYYVDFGFNIDAKVLESYMVQLAY